MSDETIFTFFNIWYILKIIKIFISQYIFSQINVLLLKNKIICIFNPLMILIILIKINELWWKKWASPI